MTTAPYPIRNIRIGSNRRAIDAAKVADLARSIDLIGLLNPVTVAEDGRLIAGLHRIEAFRLLGRDAIPAVIVRLEDDQARLAEIDENLIRNELTGLEKGELLVERDAILSRLGQRAKPGDNQFGQGGETVSPPQTTADMAASVGLSERSAQQLMQAARDIAPDVRDAIRDTPIANSTRTLLDLARSEPDEQRVLAEKLVSGEARSVDAARRLMAGETKPDADPEPADDWADDGPEGDDQWAADPDDSDDEPALISAAPQPSRLAPLMSSESPDWYTPADVLARVVSALGTIDLDPCSNSREAPNVPAACHFTQEDDGLRLPWAGRVFMNPPYGDGVGDWVERLRFHYLAGLVPAAIALLPARTDTRWWQVLSGFPVCFIRGRLKFSGHDNSATFPSALIYLGSDLPAFCAAFAGFGVFYAPIGETP